MDSPKNSSIKILIVEDDPLLVKLYKTVFEKEGCEVETAFNGEIGFEKLNKMASPPTLILSDVMMPKMNGLEMLKKIKEEPKFNKIPVVLLTNLGGEKDAETGLSLGAVTYIVKSQYVPADIVKKIKEVLAGYTRDNPVPEVKTPIKDIES
jgi:CheY-like chemotaxis protein